MNKGIGKVYTTKRNTRNVGEGFVQGEDYVKTRNVGIGRFPSSELQSNRSEGNVIIDGESRFVKSKFVNDSPKPIPSFLAFSDYTTYPLSNERVIPNTNVKLLSPERVFCIKMDVAGNASGASQWFFNFSNKQVLIRYHYSYAARRWNFGKLNWPGTIGEHTPYYLKSFDNNDWIWTNGTPFSTSTSSSMNWHPIKIIYQPSEHKFRNVYIETGEFVEYINTIDLGDELVSVGKSGDRTSYKVAFRNIEIYDCDTYENALAI